MNSMSKCHDNHDNCKKEKDLCPTVIKCSQAGSVTVPAATVLGTSFPLTALTVNTECLKNPCVKLEFTSNLVAAVAFTGTINFQVFKQCRGQSTPIPVGPAYTFNLVALLSSQTFSFFVCDCGDFCCDECCTYTVSATVTSAVTVGTLSINNATLGAIATCGSSSCC
ncbi:DUF4489 domain-containing protein [Clostridium beijerinckii]|jgi:hypothetical protein|uniref:DUF4489 domain-containing protein n=1 Tax=Clostridium beijerinckii TaxID=1520 RepID=A0AAW3W847_CLOBE|nr:DUF4489 domain-containing protein [Clostridium beijerinckii]MBC2457664.1 DUF4489 domain-containing protein [Clostridium beijerinckii]MBC2474937.1 DUF4489 domain-containing protein [Clostridium beijerinckii]MCI1579684.1 DUF4489 domain-containing protein [Clostridium beijerinckii]MCI1583652.1 DUF4489 domain-containing protein [Clostridium beijerinckii]MCI1622895.1 DUF4489 domain-containing protein [Clostridium beijerinckii]